MTKQQKEALDQQKAIEKQVNKARKMLKQRSRHRNIADWIEFVTEIIEILVAVIVLAGFFISMLPLVLDMRGLIDNTNDFSFHVFLEHAFNLIIGIEFVRMLIKHTPGSALDVLLFAIARHMVLSGESGADLLWGIASLAGIFAIRKYLYVHSFESSKDHSNFEWIRRACDEPVGMIKENIVEENRAPEDKDGTVNYDRTLENKESVDKIKDGH